MKSNNHQINNMSNSKGLIDVNRINKVNISNKKPFRIICIKEYEFEGRIFKVGEIGYHSHGRLIPSNWEKLSVKSSVSETDR